MDHKTTCADPLGYAMYNYSSNSTITNERT